MSNCYFDILVSKSPYLSHELERHRLLENCTIHCKAGYVTSFLGDAKTTSCLLKLISLRSQDGIMAGELYHDNVIRKQGQFTDIAYVTTFNSHYFDHLTVSDYLRWAAQLRLSNSLMECQAIAMEVSGLVGVEPTSQVKDLSGGERILLSLASELVSSPTLLCLDRPLEGLEEHEAINVLAALRRIAKRPNYFTTIVFTCSGLSADMLPHVHSLHVLLHGSVVYSTDTHLASSRCWTKLTLLSRLLITLESPVCDASQAHDRLSDVLAELQASPPPDFSASLVLPLRTRHLPSNQIIRITKPLFEEVLLLLSRALSCVISNV